MDDKISRRKFIPLVGTALLGASCLSIRDEADFNKEIIRPKKLVKGSTIGLCATAGPIRSGKEVDEFSELLKSKGFEVKEGINVRKKHGYFSAPDKERAQEFMEMIGRGMCPPELMHPGASARNPVKIDLKREMRDWEAPKGVKAFSGSGNKLTSEADGENKEGGQQKALEEVKPWAVDDKEPTTSIQIRLHDGSRLVAKFNLSHTVAHIRDFIRQAKGEQCATRALQLSGFPPEKLDDDSRTIENGLKGCVVQQK